MATKTKVARSIKSAQWLKNVLHVKDSEIKAMKKSDFPVVYVYQFYPYGGGDDRIAIVNMSRTLTDEEMQKRFSNTKIKGKLFGGVCEIDLRKGEVE